MKNLATILAICAAGRSPASAIINTEDHPSKKGTRNYFVNVGKAFNPSGGMVHPHTEITNYDPRCGGTIISSRAILTAAHCFTKMELGGCSDYAKVGDFDSVGLKCNTPLLGYEGAPTCYEQCNNYTLLTTSVVNIDNYDIRDVPGGTYLPICAGENGATSSVGITGIPCDKSTTAYVVRNPDYNPGVNADGVQSHFDLALILLAEKDAITDIEPVTLNKDSTVPKAGDALVAIGRGVTNPKPNEDEEVNAIGGIALASASPIPLTVSLGYVGNQNEMCTSAAETIADNQLCAYTENKGVCYGDSGGPLMLENHDGTSVQVGIVDFVPETTASNGTVELYCIGDKADAFVRVSEVNDWITKTVCEEVGELCPKSKSGEL
jgi:V8-like Glu-specific endopeptidase